MARKAHISEPDNTAKPGRQIEVDFILEHITQIKELADEIKWNSEATRGRAMLHLGSFETFVTEQRSIKSK